MSNITPIKSRASFEPDEMWIAEYYLALDSIFSRWASGEISKKEAIKQIDSEKMQDMKPDYSFTHAVRTYIANNKG